MGSYKKKLKPWKLNKNPNLYIEFAHNILNKEITIFRVFFGKPKTFRGQIVFVYMLMKMHLYFLPNALTIIIMPNLLKVMFVISPMSRKCCVLTTNQNIYILMYILEVQYCVNLYKIYQNYGEGWKILKFKLIIINLSMLYKN